MIKQYDSNLNLDSFTLEEVTRDTELIATVKMNNETVRFYSNDTYTVNERRESSYHNRFSNWWKLDNESDTIYYYGHIQDEDTWCMWDLNSALSKEQQDELFAQLSINNILTGE